MFHNQEQKTAILVFAQSAIEEIRQKRIAKSLDLFKELNSHIINEVKKTGVPYFLFSEELQKGDSFGERFVNAIQLVYDNGFDNVITIGNDSPQLKSKHLIAAAHALDKGKSVIGPSVDGGFYLLGLNKENFNRGVFMNFSWQRQTLSKEVSKYFKELKIQTERLGYLFDIDSLQDIKLLLKAQFGSLSAIIKGLLTRFFAHLHIESEHICNLIKPNKCGLCDLVRGSP